MPKFQARARSISMFPQHCWQLWVALSSCKAGTQDIEARQGCYFLQLLCLSTNTYSVFPQPDKPYSRGPMASTLVTVYKDDVRTNMRHAMLCKRELYSTRCSTYCMEPESKPIPWAIEGLKIRGARGVQSDSGWTCVGEDEPIAARPRRPGCGQHAVQSTRAQSWLGLLAARGTMCSQELPALPALPVPCSPEHHIQAHKAGQACSQKHSAWLSSCSKYMSSTVGGYMTSVSIMSTAVNSSQRLGLKTEALMGLSSQKGRPIPWPVATSSKYMSAAQQV